MATLLVSPFVIASGGALAKIYPHGGSRHSVFLAIFIAAGAGIGLGWPLRRRLLPVVVVTAVLFPLEIDGDPGMDLAGSLFDYLHDSERFDLKQWDKSMAVQQGETDDKAISDMARKQEADFVIATKATARENSLEIRTRLIETDTLDVVSVEDVYNENLDREQIQKMCKGLVVKLRDALPLIQGKVVKIKGKKVTINLGKAHGLKKGMHLVFFEEGESIKDPDTGEDLGADTEELGAARIRKVKKKMSKVEILDEDVLEDLEVGYSLVMK